MKNLILTVLSTSMLMVLSANAQTAQKDINPKDPKAEELLSALSSKAKGYKSFKADFEYTLVNKADGLNETRTGSVMMKGEKKYKLNVAGQTIMSNGETVWTYIQDVGELQISDVPEEDDEDGNLMNPANAFHMYENGFKYQYAGSSTVSGRAVEVVKMFPLQPEKKPYHTVIVNIDKAKNELVSTVVKSKDGNVYTYVLKNFKVDIPVTDADFEFDEDQAEDIIDLRE